MLNYEYYEVWDNFSEDGRDSSRDAVIARFLKFTDANRYARKRGNYGQDAHVREVKVCVAESLLEMDNIVHAEKKQAALDKLTDEEKRILGLLEE